MTVFKELDDPAVSGAVVIGGGWARRPFHAPHGAAWVPSSFERLISTPCQPPMRGLRPEPDGSWTVEERSAADLLPLAAYLTKSAASIWVFVSIVQHCLAGLRALHDCGFPHGAITAGNIMVDPAGNAFLAGCAGIRGVPDPDGRQRGAAEAPALPHTVVTEDLRALGRAFRAVLSGDAEGMITVSRPDIAPLVAEWIDWLADPQPSFEPVSAAQAETVFSDIRTGRAGWRPWQSRTEPAAAGDAATTWRTSESPEEEKAKAPKASVQAHGSGMDLRGLLLLGVGVLVLVAGGAWALSHFLAGERKKAAVAETPAEPPPAPPLTVKSLDGGDELNGASGGDVEPMADTEEEISKLMAGLNPPAKVIPEWEKALERRKLDRAAVPEEPAGADSEDIYLSRLFPAVGKPSGGREPGDYYLVWQTNRFVMTMDECRTLQRAVLRSARYCGVRLLAWTVLPNQVGVVLRVLPRYPLPDEKLSRRIAILRGEKAAAKVMSQINAKEKEGDAEGADGVRRAWMANMGTAAGFYNVTKLEPVVAGEALRGALWQAKAVHMALLNPDSREVLYSAAVVDTAAVKGGLVENAPAWPLCSLTAAMHRYGPALRAVSVLMQKNPQSALPLPTDEQLNKALNSYRRFLGDLPEEPNPPAPAKPAADVEAGNSNPEGVAGGKQATQVEANPR